MADILNLEFSLPPTDLGRLRQHPALGLVADASRRPGAVRMTWYDTEAGALATQGLALVSARRAWRLERSRPNAEPWPPATEPPVLLRDASQAVVAAQLPAGVAAQLAQTGALTGRETVVPVGEGDAAVTARILRCRIRAGEQGMPCARLFLSGPEPAVVGLALALSETVGLLPPRASLAAEAQALAAGGDPPPRRVGTFAITGGLTVGEAFPCVIAHLTDVMLAWARAIGEPGQDPEPVHQMRVAMRRLRSAISIFRHACGTPTVLDIGAGLRELGHVLGPAREWDVFLAGLGQRIATALPDDAEFQNLLRHGGERRAAAYARLHAHVSGPAFRHLVIRLSALGAGTHWRNELDDAQRAVMAMPLESFASELLTRRHRRVRKRGDHFRHLDVPALHEVRLAAKRLRYAAEFFSALFAPRAAARYVRRLSALQDELGHLNDAAVADGLLRQLGPAGYAAGLVRGYVLATVAHHRHYLRRTWKRFRRMEPFWT